MTDGSGGPTLGHYEIRRGLGRGAMGRVYLAYDTRLGRDVAIKVLDENFARRDKHRQRFEREARTIAALRHPNIVEIFDVGGSPDDHLYIVMEYIAGPSTAQLCRTHGPLPESVLIAIGMELTAALAHAHQNGILHRDLKPENVFLDRGRLVLADFGIAKAYTEANPLGPAAATPRTDVIGTPGFMAPEQFEERPLDPRTDIFAFGALLYHLATGLLPFQGDSPIALQKAFRDTRPQPLHKRRRHLSAEFSDLVLSCLCVEPAARPNDCDVLRRRLHALFEAAGGREPRDVLAEYERDPAGLVETERARALDHLLGDMKIAVREQDRQGFERLRRRLRDLDPKSQLLRQISGITALQRRPAGARAWIWIAVASFVAVAMVALTAWLTR